MENEYYSDEEENLSIHSSFAFFENNKLPKINGKKKVKKKNFGIILEKEKAEIMI